MPDNQPNDFVERFNREGGPVPEANPDLMKKMWTRTREAGLRGDATKTSGLGAIGIDASELGDAPRDAMTVLIVRLQLLQSLFERNVLREYLHGDELVDEVFKAAATLPCDKEEIGEAIVQLMMKHRPEADFSELKSEMIAHGYNPEAPKIDSKFLAWMRNR
jgi:hypothetical protein